MESSSRQPVDRIRTNTAEQPRQKLSDHTVESSSGAKTSPSSGSPFRFVKSRTLGPVCFCPLHASCASRTISPSTWTCCCRSQTQRREMATHRSMHGAVDVDVVDRVSNFLGDRSQLMARQPSSIWRGFHSAPHSDGHTGSPDFGSTFLAKWTRREADRIYPAGLPRSRGDLCRAASSPFAQLLPRIL